MRGRKPVPSHLKVLRGTDQPCRMNPDEPKPEPSEMTAPPGLSPAALKEWDRVKKVLAESGIVSVLDTNALAAYCEMYAIWASAIKHLQREGMVVSSKRGEPMRNPYLKIANDAHDRMVKMLTEFGMTPSSRTRVSATKKQEKPDDKWGKYRG